MISDDLVFTNHAIWYKKTYIISILHYDSKSFIIK